MALTSGRNDEFRPSPGFQRSETTGVEVNIYPQNGDPVVISTSTVPLDGRRRSDKNPSIVSANMSTSMGAASGSWQVSLKPGQRHITESLLSTLNDDDWVDLTFTRHARRWHTMRGLLKNIRRTTAVGGTGATTEVIALSGKGFGSIWEQTPIWFNPYSEENFGGAQSQKAFGALEGVLGSPDKAVVGYLKNMLRQLGGTGRATWVLPLSMPNRGEGSFVGAVDFDTSQFPKEFKTGGPKELTGLSSNWLMPQGNLWQLAQQWSDPIFNELFTDVLPGLLAFNPEEELLVDDTELTLIFREKPFPTLEKGRNSAWFDLPLSIVPREQILNADVGRSGDERYNAFFVAPQIVQEAMKQSAIDIHRPLWNERDIDRHGMKRFDIASKYAIKDSDISGLAKEQRRKVRDWYCINPYLLNGTLALATGRPDIHLGTRVRIPGSLGKNGDETYYVEQVDHSWTFGPGTRTNLGVTRGFLGDEDTLLDVLGALVDEYTEGTPAEAGLTIPGLTITLQG